MAKKEKLTDSEEISAHIQKLDKSIAPIIEFLRKTILGVHKEVGERIKWNNPSFYYTGEMAPFDPKEYKREIIVFNLHKNRIMLVFTSGAKITKHKSLLEGDYKDGRRLLIVKDLADAKNKASEIKNIVNEWLSLVEK